MRKFITLIATMAVVASLVACVRTNTQVTNTNNDVTTTTSSTEEGYQSYWDTQKKIDSYYKDGGWIVLEPGIYIEPIQKQVDVWGGDTGAFYNVLMPGVYNTDEWAIYRTDDTYDQKYIEYGTDEFSDVQERAIEAWENYKNKGIFVMSDESYAEWFKTKASSYDEWAWTRKYLNK